MTEFHFTILAGIAGFVLQAGIMAVSVTWKIALVAAELRAESIRRADGLRVEMEADRKNWGEAFQSIRAQQHLIELYAAKNYVLRESWHQAMNGLQVQLAAEEKAGDEWKTRIEAKIDKLTERLMGAP